MEYGITTFLEYNEQPDSDFFNSGVRVRLSPIPFVANNNAWSQRFSPSYTPFEETDKQSSYLYLDGCKISSASARAPSTDSLNIRTDEKMPAKGEISEQESNGDIEGSWSHQVILNTFIHLKISTISVQCLNFNLFFGTVRRSIRLLKMIIYRGIRIHTTQRLHARAGA